MHRSAPPAASEADASGRPVTLEPEAVAAVILTYGDRRTLLERTLTACAGAGATTLVVVGNGCRAEVGAGIRAMLAEMPHAVTRFVELPANQGSAGGFDAGIMAALSLPRVERVWLLDDDNAPRADALTALLAARARVPGHEEVTLLSCRPDRPYIADYAGTRVRTVLPSSFLSFNVLHYLPGRRTRPVERLHGLPRVPIAPYGGMLIERATLERLGGPDTRFILYADDTEFSLRLIRNGVPVLLVEGSIVVDAEPSGMAPRDYGWFGQRAWLEMPALRAYYSFRNDVFLSARQLRGNPLLFALNASIVCGALLVIGVAGRRWERLRLLSAALRDGLLGRLGPRRPGYPPLEEAR